MLRIGFLTHGTGLRSLSDSERYAYGWICERPEIAARLLPAAEAAGTGVDILWWHAARCLPPDSPALRAVTAAITEPVESGTPLLLTGSALCALPPLGLEEEYPRTTDGAPWDGPVSEHELRGHLTFAGHPAFSSFGTGAYTWKPAAGVPVWDAWYEAARDSDYRPRGRVVCVERRYIGLEISRLTGLSWQRGASRIGALGAHLPFHDRTNPLRGHLELLIEGWLHWLAGTAPAVGNGEQPGSPARGDVAERQPASGPTGESPRRFLYAGFRLEQRDRGWPEPRWEVHESDPDPLWAGGDLPLPLPAPGPEAFAGIWDAPSPGGYENVSEDPADVFFDTAGSRHFILGHARSGVAEAWTGGVRLFRRLALSWEGRDRDPVLCDDPRRDVCRRTVARPDSWRREMLLTPGENNAVHTPGENDAIHLRQIVAAHPDRGGGSTLIEVESPAGGTLRFEAIVDLRLQWPLPAGILAPLAFSHPAPGLVTVTGSEREIGGALALSGPAGPGRWVAASSSAPDPSGSQEQAAVRLVGEVDLASGRAVVELAWAVTENGPRSLVRTLADLIVRAERNFRLGNLRLGRLAVDRVQLETRGTRFGDAFNRAVAGLEGFSLTSDRLGTSLLAGFNTTGKEWLSGRPGYAWFFGRDGIFTALGLLALGEREEVAAVLRFLAAHQEFTGKILHEATLSGVVHYDSADATPLWLILLGAWYRATGDKGLVRELWPALTRALAFCRHTDTDRDGLIENTGVGHGWIEGGALYGAHVTNYLAGVWAAAAEAAALCAEAVGERETAAGARRDAERARAALEKIFWIEQETGGTGSSGHYALGLNSDRTLQEDLTIMPTVPILLGQTDPERSRAHLLGLAGEACNADWGVRMVGRSHPAFNPRGYHYGSIWPLYTGWTALAEYRTHRHEAGLAHLFAGLATVFDPPAGAIEEVLHGERYEPAGVCPHQAWSHAVLLQAAVEGLIGWRPDARPGGQSVLAPHLPETWDGFRCRGLRVGERLLSCELTGTPGRKTWRLELTGGEKTPVELRFSPALPPEARLEQMVVDGQAEHAIISDTADDQHVELDLNLVPGRPIEIALTYVFDLVPVIPEPALEPGRESRQWRLLDRWWEGGGGGNAALPEACRLIFEGPPGSTARIPCLVPGRRPKAVLGAEWAEPPRKGRGELLVTFPPAVSDEEGDDRYTAAVVQVSFV